MRAFLPCLLALTACVPEEPDDDVGDSDPPVVCDATPPEALQRFPGPQADGSFLALDGREATPAGAQLALRGFPSDVLLHPALPIAYVTTTAADDRALLVVDLDTLTVVQEVDRRAFPGLALTEDGSTLVAAGGAGDFLSIFDVGTTGTVSLRDDVPVGIFSAGVALDEANDRVWTAGFLDGDLVEVSLATRDVTRVLTVPANSPSTLLFLPSRRELWMGDLIGDELLVVDVDAWEVIDRVPLQPSVTGLSSNADGSVIYVAVANASEIVAVDAATRTQIARSSAGDDDWLDEQGAPLPNSNPNGTWYSPDTDRLYVTQGWDNAVHVLDGTDLTPLGQIPVGAYPTDAAVTSDGRFLVVTEGQGSGAAGRLESAAAAISGSLSVIDLDQVDLAATTAEAKANYRRPIDLFPFTCEGTFPVPARPGLPTPIKHVVLVVKENKTFDCVLGDLEGVEADPQYVRFGEEVTPNQHRIARTFALSDNFYTQVQESDTGHLFLTNGTLTEFGLRGYLEQSQSASFLGLAATAASVPTVGNLFTHLMDRGIDLRIYGEIVGTFTAAADGRTPFALSDPDYPGGVFYNYSAEDEERARYLLETWAAEDMPQLAFVLFPNDHTAGTGPSSPTPESMVADGDLAVGLLVEGLSQRPDWDEILVIVLQDDPQSCRDHIDPHRSFLLLASPWVKRGYTSHVQASFLSVYATIERILGVPPIGRPDASAAALWDMFTQTPDLTPYKAAPRRVPKRLNAAGAPGAERSAAMDFRGPDRNPELALVLDAYMLWRDGQITLEEAEDRIAHPDPEWLDELEEEAEEEGAAFEEAWRQYTAWLTEQGQPIPVRHRTPPAPPGYPEGPTLDRP